MTETTDPTLLRHVLWGFSQECPLPTLDDVRRWQAKHPEHADDILTHAASVIEDVLDPDIDGYIDLRPAHARQKTTSANLGRRRRDADL